MAKQKNNIRITVQGDGVFASQFADKLESISDNIVTVHKLETPPTLTLTSASDGRQTAIFQFITKEKEEVVKPAYTDSDLLHAKILRILNRYSESLYVFSGEDWDSNSMQKQRSHIAGLIVATIHG